MQAYLAQLYTLAYLGDDYWRLSEYILKMRLIGADLNAAYKFTKRVTDKGGVQFLSDKLSEVSKNRHKFLHVDFAAVSEKNRRFVCVCEYIFRNCCLSSSYSALSSAEYRKSSLRIWTPLRRLRRKRRLMRVKNVSETAGDHGHQFSN